MIRFALVFGSALANPAFAQDGPSFDCAKAQSSVETLICADAVLAALDQRVSDRYADALAVVQGLDAGADEAEKSLRSSQRGWIKGRDDCWKGDDVKACVEDAYLMREAALVAQWMLEQPFNVATWMCGDTPANAVVTYFFDTPLPSVRFERGETIDVGTVVRTGSGAKYDGSFGRSIWMKGEAATYREADPDGTSYTCTLVAQN
jgi:uncharacterized protein